MNNDKKTERYVLGHSLVGNTLHINQEMVHIMREALGRHKTRSILRKSRQVKMGSLIGELKFNERAMLKGHASMEHF